MLSLQAQVQDRFVSSSTGAAAPERDNQDYTHSVVPQSERRGTVTMGLLWITMVTCFPGILAGFQWFNLGISLPQVVQGVLVSSLIVLLYSLPACYLGSKTGLTYTLLSRSVFGRWGARFVTVNILLISTCWYALNAIFLADGIRGLFNLQFPELWFATGIAILMAINNFFGFSGVANFARFLAAPILIVWVFLALARALPCVPDMLSHPMPSSLSPMHSLSVISSFVLGVACWGNEPDYWRYGKPKFLAPLAPLVVALVLGQILFPLAGWMMAQISGASDTASATSFMNKFVFGGASLISAVVLAVSYVAVNDSGLYAAINAAENLKAIPRKICVAILALFAAALTVALFGYTKNFETVAALSSIFLPCATTIMIAECFLISRICGVSEKFSVVPEYSQLPALRVAAATALVSGAALGTLTAGFIPGTEHLRFGIPAVNAWTLTLLLYLLLRPLEIKYASDPLITADTEPSAQSPAPTRADILSHDGSEIGGSHKNEGLEKVKG